MHTYTHRWVVTHTHTHSLTHSLTQVGGVRSALVSMKSKTLSNGFGFVEFASMRDAKHAQQQLQVRVRVRVRGVCLRA